MKSLSYFTYGRNRKKVLYGLKVIMDGWAEAVWHMDEYRQHAEPSSGCQKFQGV